MGFQVEERQSDSPYVESVMHGYTSGSGVTIRPAEVHWHMVMTRHTSGAQFIVTGPLTTSGEVTFEAGAQILWIQFRLGAFLPAMPAVTLRDAETPLPLMNRQSFWLDGQAWQFPTYENADTFVERLVRGDVLQFDPVIDGVLRGRSPDLAPRTVRHRFLQATGLTQNQIFQVERAQQAAALLEQGTSILDTVEQAGYFDQPHLTRSLKRWVGYTPGQVLRTSEP